MPLPDVDFDPTEVAAPWSVLSEAGHEVVFATASGDAGRADPRVLNGVIFGQLGAEPDARALYAKLETAPEFARPLSWSELAEVDADAVLLPGGHAQGMRPYLESPEVQAAVLGHWQAERPIAAICHGVIVLARTLDPTSKHSVLRGRRSSCLPKYMERIAYYSTAWRLGRYYRTYPEYVEDEVKRALGPDGHFERGPFTLFQKGTRSNDGAAFVVEDGNYLSARWPGDAYAIGKRLAERLATTEARQAE